MFAPVSSQPSLWRRVRCAWGALRGNVEVTSCSSPDPPPASDALVERLARSPMSVRERRLLLLFCDGGRSTVPGDELQSKFGVGIPIDAGRDAPDVAAFCESHNMAFPFRALGGSADETVYELSWTAAQRRRFSFVSDDVSRAVQQ